ncbi:hypothetical protein AK812_SmicGene35119 [Symbiodinium microadriaticum]|uniref:Uncharacterized protein n=1 Tax=Symbiodinium microadriaticum TaxID=2951 RepID=A0A1Q9CMF2_SYMMI|nr:hypothetical protein AK812_SmicGene35119 [Symbiodinium microadriaticum]
MIKAESAPLVKSEQIGSLAGRDQPGLTVGSKALEAPGDQAQQNHDETATLATAVAANSRLDSGLVLPTLGLPHYLFIKRARQAIRQKKYAEAGDLLQMGLTDLTAMVDLGKFIELLRGASRDSMPSMSALFLDPATEAPEPRRLLAAQMPWLREGTPRVISRQDLDTGFYISPTSSLGSGSCRAAVSAASPFFVDATPIVAASPASNAFCVPKGKSTGELVQEPRVPLKPLNRLPRGESKAPIRGLLQLEGQVLRRSLLQSPWAV